MRKISYLLFGLLLLCAFAKVSMAESSLTLKKPVTTSHMIQLKSGPLAYLATVGVKPIYNSKHQLMAGMSYIAYIKKGGKNRPLTFVWSGGPGNSTLASNLLVSGPKLIDLEGNNKVVTNPTTWLRFTDLVYIDMTGTGWGKPSASFIKDVYTPEGDAYTFSEFIKSYLMEEHRAKSPIFLSGISYGGYRLPLVSNNLLKSMMPISGYILQSPLLKLSYTFESFGNTLPYVLSFPTFIHTALYHQKLSANEQKNPQKTIREGTEWALKKYPYYLFLGDKLSPQQKEEITQAIHRYTGLAKEIIQKNNYRVSMDVFRQSLLKENKEIDYTDGAMLAIKLHSDYGIFPFTMSSFLRVSMLPYPASVHHLKSELKANVTGFYVNYFDPQKVWSWPANSAREVISMLRDNLLIDASSKLFLGLGYLDTDIPYMASEMAMNQMMLTKEAQKRVHVYHYNGGHMFSSSPKIRDQFNNDVMHFVLSR